MSLDCEGRWGMADHLQPYHDSINSKNLLEAYRKLLSLLRTYEIPATFAFVGAFVLDDREREQFHAELLADNDPWLEPYQALHQTQQGWHQPDTLSAVLNDGRHEVACHGFCHRPMGGLTAGEARAELAAASRVAKLKGVNFTTFVFPRNDVAHLSELQAAGYVGYRRRLKRPSGIAGKVKSIADEFDIATPPQTEQSVEKPVPIPSGYFFNWRHGARKIVPPAVTVRRWRNLLHSACSRGEVAHLWLHPHNIITAPETFDVLKSVIEEVAVIRDAGKLTVETQANYCDRKLAPRSETVLADNLQSRTAAV